jgi:L-fuconolactonase
MIQMIIDSHLHIWDLARFPYPWIAQQSAALLRQTYLPDDIWPQFARLGVSGAVFIQATELIEESEWVLGLTEQYPWLLGVVGWADLAAPNIDAELARLARHKRYKGVRAGLDAPAWLLDDRVQPGLRALARHGLSLDVIAGEDELPLVPELARRHPELTIIVDHVGSPATDSGDLAAWQRDLAAAAALANVVTKLSGLLTQAQCEDGSLADIGPVVQTALACFGSHRLMFGGDWPVSLIAASYPATLEATQRELRDLAPDDAANIWHATARRVYRLGP